MQRFSGSFIFPCSYVCDKVRDLLHFSTWCNLVHFLLIFGPAYRIWYILHSRNECGHLIYLTCSEGFGETARMPKLVIFRIC